MQMKMSLFYCFFYAFSDFNKSRQATDSTDKISLRIDRSLQTWELTFEKHYLDNNPLVWNELRLESNLLKDLELSLIFN